METIELLGVENGFSASKLIQVLRTYSEHTTIEILDVLNRLDSGKAVVVKLKPKAIEEYNEMLKELSYLNVRLGNSSYLEQTV